MMDCDGFCAAAFPWLIVAAQLSTIGAVAWTGARGWIARPVAVAGIRVAGALLVAYAYVGSF